MFVKHLIYRLCGVKGQMSNCQSRFQKSSRNRSRNRIPANSYPPVSTIKWTNTKLIPLGWYIHISSAWAAEKKMPLRDQVGLRWVPSNISHDCDRFRFRRFAGASACNCDQVVPFALLIGHDRSRKSESLQGKVSRENSSKRKTSLFRDISTAVKSLGSFFFWFCFFVFASVSLFSNDVLEIHSSSPWSHSYRAHDTVNNFCLLSRPFTLTIHQICSHLWGVNKTITRKAFTTVMDWRSKQETCFLQRDHYNGKQNWSRTPFPTRKVSISLYEFPQK